MSNCESRLEEFEALVAIYSDDRVILEVNGDTSVVTKIKFGRREEEDLVLHLDLPEEYPSERPPNYSISAPTLTGEQKKMLSACLDEVWSANPGESIIFSWIEKARAFLDEHFCDCEEESETKVEENNIAPPVTKCPEILTSSHVIEDRRSVFQAHFARVISQQEVKAVVEKLLTNRKIAAATHNMYAYRISSDTTSAVTQDCDDDGETHAGSRMLHLLDIVDARNVFVMVSRWYGGIHLGPDRFKHINNATRNILEEVGVITVSNSKKTRR